MSFAQVQLLGNLGRDPELTLTQEGTPVTKFTIAVNRKRGEKEETTWYNCTAWRGLAEMIEKYARKGAQVFVQGELTPRSYTTKEGRAGMSLDVTVDKFSFAGSYGEKKPAGTGQRQDAGADAGDPFLPDFPDDI